MIQSKEWFFTISILIVTLTACALPGLPGEIPAPAEPSEPPAAQLLPDLPGYKTIEGQTLTDAIGKTADADALQKESPNLTELLTKIDGVISCYQETGAARARLYSNVEKPWSVGAIAITDRNAMLNPANLFKCVGNSGDQPQTMAKSAAAPDIEPCSATYTLSRNNNQFYILYVGTTGEICRDFCANLEGCTAH
ncbi:MAG TPA: hypothetical protein G4N96_04535 [Chloroflexi bacterium]|nr:MAG: hypothetical protein B6243_06510 [Anaerolineaceae bacterium 4572_5.2]HEY84368.1 hypothetical protein [Chloroflexota bacterium]